MASLEKEQIEQALDRIIGSAGFQGSDRLCRFLRFTVDSRLRGEQERIKEYLIGREVFDRNGDYDPRIDPIVRVEARRLRKKLDEYYSGPGASDPVRIDFPKGSYVPVFAGAEAEETVAAAVPVAKDVESVAGEPKVAEKRRPRWWLIAALGGVALAAAYFAGEYWLSVQKAAASRESLAVIPARWVWRNDRDFSNELHDEDIAERVSAELAAKPGAAMRVIAWPSLQKYRTNAGTMTTREIAGDMGVSRVLIVTVRVEAAGQRATAFLIRAKTEGKLGVYDRSGLDLGSPEARQRAASELAAAIVAMPGWSARE